MEERPIIGVVEDVTVNGETVTARIDTGAKRSSIDEKLAERLGISPGSKTRTVKSASGTQERPVAEVTIELHGQTITEEFTLADRDHMQFDILIGRNILRAGKFLVDALSHSD